MMKPLFITGVLLFVAILASTAFVAGAADFASPTTDVPDPPDEILALAVGESYTIEINVTRQEHVVLSTTFSDPFYSCSVYTDGVGNDKKFLGHGNAWRTCPYLCSPRILLSASMATVQV